MLEKELALPYFQYVYDEHWDLGHGRSRICRDSLVARLCWGIQIEVY